MVPFPQPTANAWLFGVGCSSRNRKAGRCGFLSRADGKGHGLVFTGYQQKQTADRRVAVSPHSRGVQLLLRKHLRKQPLPVFRFRLASPKPDPGRDVKKFRISQNGNPANRYSAF